MARLSPKQSKEVDKAIQAIEENADNLSEVQRMHVENICYLILRDE